MILHSSLENGPRRLDDFGEFLKRLLALVVIGHDATTLHLGEIPHVLNGQFYGQSCPADDHAANTSAAKNGLNVLARQRLRHDRSSR